jgi:hypothetical protein
MWTRAKGGPSAPHTDPTPRGELTNWRLEELVRAGFDAELAAGVRQSSRRAALRRWIERRSRTNGAA